MKKHLKRLGILLGVGLLGGFIYFWPLIDQIIRFSPRVTEASFAQPANPLEAQQQDLEYLASVLDYDRSFSADARDRFLAELESLRAATEPMGDAEFYMRTHALMALADNAHTGSDYVPAFRQFNRSGLDFYHFADGIYVVRAHQNHADLIGHKLISVEGNDTAAIFDALAEYGGGPRERRDLNSLYFLRSPELLHGAGLAAQPMQLTVTLENADGVQAEHVLEALPSVAESEFVYRHPYHTLRPDGFPEEEGQWARALDDDASAVPLTLTDDGDLVLSAPMDGGLYIRSNYLWEYPGHEVESQLVEALEGAPEGGYAFIFVDLRWNPGGRFGHAIPFAESLESALAPDGQVYVATGPQTFSAAIVTAALIKQHVPDRVTIIGEPFGDRPQFWAERGQPFVLPNSGYHMAYATGYHDWERPCSDEVEHCFPPSRKAAADIGDFVVDVLLQPTFAQYAAGEDPVLDWALAQH